MEETLYVTSLYDYYGELLTDKQREYFEDYYFNNLSLSEIADNNDISRNAIHKQIKDTIAKLKNYEEKLKLLEKRKKIEKIIIQVDQKTQDKIKELI